MDQNSYSTSLSCLKALGGDQETFTHSMNILKSWIIETLLKSVYDENRVAAA